MPELGRQPLGPAVGGSAIALGWASALQASLATVLVFKKLKTCHVNRLMKPHSECTLKYGNTSVKKNAKLLKLAVPGNCKM